MKKIILFVILILPTIMFAQTWQWAKQIGGPGMDGAYVRHVDAQHNIYLSGGYAIPYAGSNFNNCYISNDTLYGSKDAFLAKYDGSGNLLWVKNCVSPSSYIGISGFVFDSINSIFYIAGQYQYSCIINTCNLSTTNQSMFLAKLDVNGNCLWAKNIGEFPYGTTYVISMTRDNFGNIFFAGNTDVTHTIDTSTITPGTFLAKFDSNGNSLWAKTKIANTGSLQTQLALQSLKYFNNNIYASVIVYAASFNDTIRVDTLSLTNLHGKGYGLLCMDATNCNAKWLKLEGFPNNNHYSRDLMDMDSNGNIYYTGSFSDSCFIAQDTLIAISMSNGFLSKYDVNGNLQYVKQLYSNGELYSFGIKTLANGSCFLTGAFSGQGNFGSYNVNSSTPQDLFISRYDSNGVCLGVDHAGVGSGLSISADESNVYMTGVFPPAPRPSDTINIAGSTFINYGWEDIVFAKHDMISGISEETRQANNSLIIYSNPNKGSFSLKIPDDFKNEQKLTLNIFDNNGKLIRQQFLNMNDEHPILDVYGEAKGVYTVTLSNTRKRYNGKMIVQ